MFPSSSRKSSDELLMADTTIPLARYHSVIPIYHLNILVSWLDLLHLIYFQCVTVSVTPAQAARKDVTISWMGAISNQNGS